MSNRLYITLTKFVDETSVPTYGFTASDSYGEIFENRCESLSEFLDLYPSEIALVQRVLSDDVFHGSGILENDGNFISDCVGGYITNYDAFIEKFHKD